MSRKRIIKICVQFCNGGSLLNSNNSGSGGLWTNLNPDLESWWNFACYRVNLMSLCRRWVAIPVSIKVHSMSYCFDKFPLQWVAIPPLLSLQKNNQLYVGNLAKTTFRLSLVCLQVQLRMSFSTCCVTVLRVV